jgi:hypothetical protein
MGVLKLSTASLAVLFTLGCSLGQPPDKPPPPVKSVFDPMTQPLERAREVQKTIDRSADNTREAIDADERGDTKRGDSSP